MSADTNIRLGHWDAGKRFLTFRSELQFRPRRSASDRVGLIQRINLVWRKAFYAGGEAKFWKLWSAFILPSVSFFYLSFATGIMDSELELIMFGKCVECGNDLPENSTANICVDCR